MAAYAAAKARIFGERALMVSTATTRRSMQLVPAPDAAGDEGRQGASRARASSRFGADVPQRPGDFGLAVDNGMAWLVRALRGRRDRASARSDERAEIARPAPDAGRRAAHPRPPQRAQRARRAGAGQRDRLPARADAARPARIPRRAAPRRARRASSTASTPSTTARAPTSARPSRRWSGLGAERAPASSSSSSAATARARTSRRWPRRWRATRARS